MSNPFSANSPAPKKPGPPVVEVAKADPPVVEVVVPLEKVAVPPDPDGRGPELGMDEVSCRTCRFLEYDGSSRSETQGGECRRHAPVPGMNQLASWPAVSWKGWCGEWESGVSDEEMVKMARRIADRESEDSAAAFAPPKEGA